MTNRIFTVLEGGKRDGFAAWLFRGLRVFQRKRKLKAQSKKIVPDRVDGEKKP